MQQPAQKTPSPSHLQLEEQQIHDTREENPGKDGPWEEQEQEDLAEEFNEEEEIFEQQLANGGQAQENCQPETSDREHMRWTRKNCP